MSEWTFSYINQHGETIKINGLVDKKGLIEEFLDDLTYCGNYPSNDLSLKSIIDKINMKREKWKKRCRI